MFKRLTVSLPAQPERTVFARLSESIIANQRGDSQSQPDVYGRRQERVKALLTELGSAFNSGTTSCDQHSMASSRTSAALHASFSPHEYGANLVFQSTTVPFKVSLDRLQPLQSAKLLRTQLLLPLMGLVAVASKDQDPEAEAFQSVRHASPFCRRCNFRQASDSRQSLPDSGGPT